ncbi:MAG: hypothetical protein R2704_06110 [Microthrixaceae bacterium]
MSDAEWLADVAAHGMVRAVDGPRTGDPGVVGVDPPPKDPDRRSRREIQRLDKVLQDGIKLTSVASKVWSKSSRAMIEMLISGQKDPEVLADWLKGMRSKILERLRRWRLLGPPSQRGRQSHYRPHRLPGCHDRGLTDEIAEATRLDPLVELWSTRGVHLDR